MLLSFRLLQVDKNKKASPFLYTEQLKEYESKPILECCAMYDNEYNREKLMKECFTIIIKKHIILL